MHINKSIKICFWMLAVVSISIILFIIFTRYSPERLVRIQEHNQATAPLVATNKLHLMSWNIQFMAGNKNNYFEVDGGEAPWPSKKTIINNIKLIGEVIAEQNPDVVLLQDIDINAVRSHGVNQLQELLKQLPTEYHNYAYTDRIASPFWPKPGFMGPMNTGLVILSKYKIKSAIRRALTFNKKVSFVQRLYQANLPILSVQLAFADSQKTLVIHNVELVDIQHPYHIPTKRRQVTQLQNILHLNETRLYPAVLGGSLNLIAGLPAYQHLTTESRERFYRNRNELSLLFWEQQAAPSIEQLQGDEARKWFTHSNNKRSDKVFDKTLDYWFVNKKAKILSHGVLNNKNTQKLSDHLPILLELKLS